MSGRKPRQGSVILPIFLLLLMLAPGEAATYSGQCLADAVTLRGGSRSQYFYTCPQSGLRRQLV